MGLRSTCEHTLGRIWIRRSGFAPIPIRMFNKLSLKAPVTVHLYLSLYFLNANIKQAQWGSLSVVKEMFVSSC